MLVVRGDDPTLNARGFFSSCFSLSWDLGDKVACSVWVIPEDPLAYSSQLYTCVSVSPLMKFSGGVAAQVSF